MNSVAFLLVFFHAVSGADDVVSIEVAAIKATQEGRDEKFFDGKAAAYRAQLKDLDFDTFVVVKSSKGSGSFGKEASFVIDDRHTLYLTPVDKQDDGRIKVKTRVEMKSSRPNQPPKNALNTMMVVVPGEHQRFVLGGPDEGSLVILAKLD